MEILWFCLVAIMLAAYVVFDGFDLGAGIIHFCVARTEDEKRKVLRSIGPVWDGNEVWLLAAGGTLYFAFPRLYASSFSGFYLPLMMVLWLLILRGVSIEFRNHVESPVWKPIWDAGFMVSSALLAVFFGAALGNVVRGVPLNPAGEFFLPLWTHFGVTGEVGILDWYTVLVGVFAFLTLTQHGALWVAMKTDEDVHRRARRIASVSWFGVLLVTVLVTILTMQVQPKVWANLTSQPWGFVFPAVAVAGLIEVYVCSRSGNDVKAFLASCAFIVGMLTSAAFGVFPCVMPSNIEPSQSLTIYNSATAAYGMKVGLAWWIPGMILVAGYFVYTYRNFAGKVSLEGEGY